MKYGINLIYSSVEIGSDISILDKIIEKIYRMGFGVIVVNVTEVRPRGIRKIIEKYDNIILRWHLPYNNENTRLKAKNAVRQFINRVYYGLGKKHCSIYSIDEEYANILSPNDLRYFDIIRLKRYSYRTINRYLKHSYLFEIFIDNLLENISESYHLLPKIKIIETKNKVLISQKRPVLKAIEIPAIYYTLIGESQKSYREPYLRLNKVIERCL